MRSVLRACAGTLALLMAFAGPAHAQTMFTSGQNVQPVFEGWQPNPDGTFSFLFGYLNRNYEEEPFIPVGPNNTLEPGPADRGQPTHFYPRRQQFVFSVKVPADWGKKEVVWTLTHNGRTSTAVGSMLPVWELEDGVWKANRGGGVSGRTSSAVPVNKAPSVTLVGGDAVTVTLPQTLTLTVAASDDLVPGPRKPRRQQVDAAAAAAKEKEKELPLAISALPSRPRLAGPTTQDKVLARAAYETGLAVTWLHYRGPGTVKFEPMTAPIKPEGADLTGRVTTTVSFSEPGTYVIRAVGDDGILTSGSNVTVTVRAAGSLTSSAER